MQTSDILNVMKNFPAVENCFSGCFPIDKIPRNIAQRSCLIFNLDPSHKTGSHWIALVRRFDNDYEIFNSLGTNFNEIQPFLKFPNAEYEFNIHAFQMSRTSTCGLYAIFFLVHRMMNIDLFFQDLLCDIFTINKSRNEKIVLEFFDEFV